MEKNVLKYIDDSGEEIAEAEIGEMIDEGNAFAKDKVDAILNSHKEVHGLESLKYNPGTSFYCICDDLNDRKESE